MTRNDYNRVREFAQTIVSAWRVCYNGHAEQNLGDTMPTKGTLIAEGAYTLQRGQAATGNETWQLSKLAHGGLVFTSRAELTRPKPIKWNFTFEISQHWSPVRFSIRLDADGKTIASDQRAQGAQWRAHIEAREGEAKDSTIDFGNKQVYFPSPLFSAVTLVRLNLQVGQAREVDALVINLLTLEPRAVKQTYTCVAEEKIQVPAGNFSAWRYTVQTAREDASSPSAPADNNFWADRHGIVLLYQSASGDEMKLARYRRIERR